MSNTIRIYNKLNLKKTQRYNLDKIIKKFKEGDITCIGNTGIPFTIRSWICMGNCKYCKEDANSTKHRRLNYEKELVLELKEEKELLKNCIPIDLIEDVLYQNKL